MGFQPFRLFVLMTITTDGDAVDDNNLEFIRKDGLSRFRAFQFFLHKTSTYGGGGGGDTRLAQVKQPLSRQNHLRHLADRVQHITHPLLCFSHYFSVNNAHQF